MNDMTEEQKETLPLRAAYEFGGLHGLEREVRDIRDMVIKKWDRSYTSTLRRGYIIALFEAKGVFDKFKNESWSFGNTPAGVQKHSMKHFSLEMAWNQGLITLLSGHLIRMRLLSSLLRRTFVIFLPKTSSVSNQA